MVFKKAVASLLASTMVLGLVACSQQGTEKKTEKSEKVATSEAKVEQKEQADSKTATEITLWTYPVGEWKDAKTVDAFIQEFNKKEPNIKVRVEYLDYKTGDDKVTAALEAKTAPDMILEGPERLVANWGAKGKMVDISDLWTDEAQKDIAATSQAIVDACKTKDGKFFEYPLCMTTHCMAINYEVFEKAGALQYLDQKTRTWTTENFRKAMKAVAESKQTKSSGIVYCGGQGGDQGTRALVTNLFGAEFTDKDHTKYTINQEKGLQGLQYLVDMVKEGSLSYDAGIAAAEELQKFANGTTAVSFCWNASNAAQYASQVKFKPFAMAFPSQDGKPQLAGGIWGFGVFNNGDEAKIAAAKKFIKFVCDDKEQAKKSVYATGFFPARASLGDIYAGTDKASNAEFSVMMPFLGDYYNVTAGWATQRTAWWNMLQAIFGGTEVKEAAEVYTKAANAAATK